MCCVLACSAEWGACAKAVDGVSQPMELLVAGVLVVIGKPSPRFHDPERLGQKTHCQFKSSTPVSEPKARARCAPLPGARRWPPAPTGAALQRRASARRGGRTAGPEVSGAWLSMCAVTRAGWGLCTNLQRARRSHTRAHKHTHTHMHMHRPLPA